MAEESKIVSLSKLLRAKYRIVLKIRPIRRTKATRPRAPVSEITSPQIVWAGTRVFSAAGSLPK